MDRIEDKWRAVLIGAILSLATLAAYWPVLNHEFINFDDRDYIIANPQVMGGLTGENIAWAFRTSHAGNWHPVTWLSHMLDVEMFGASAGGHHLANLLFHTANVLLLFGLLWRMTGAAWRSAVVAGLFALHPLHVESVAWAAERKDVLSTFFGFLALWAYARYARSDGALKSEGRSPKAEGRPKSEIRETTAKLGPLETLGKTDPAPEATFSAPLAPRHSALAPRPSPVAYYTLALGCFALSLMSKPMLVTFPFLLLLLDFWPLERGHSCPPGCLATVGRTSMTRLVLEKIPFLVLTILSSVVTLCVQHQAGAMHALGSIPLGSRLANALVSYGRYLGKTIWPVDLAVLYPYPTGWPAWQVTVAALALTLITIGAVGLARSRPYLLVGWLWYLGTLVPVIGLVQVGLQAMADRYTYFPLIGPFIMVTWGAFEVGARWRHGRLVLAGATSGVLLMLGWQTTVQVKYWQNSRTLLEHALEVTGPNAMAHNNLGTTLADQGDWVAAETHFAEAHRLQPGLQAACANLAIARARLGRAAEAIRLLAESSLATNAVAHCALGRVFLEQAKTAEALEQYSLAVKLAPGDVSARETLALELARQGQPAAASEQFAALVRLRPDAQSHYYFALALVVQGRPQAAVEQYREAIRLKPDWPEPMNDLAWLLATHPRPEVRNPGEAIRLAERACELSGRAEARFLGTLDAAYAEAGRFPEASTVGEEARKLALASGNQELAEAAAARLELYRSGRPYHQP